MNYFNLNPFDFISDMSKAKTLLHVNQLYNQIDNYQRIASLASCCSLCEERSWILEHCSHGINDCNNELRRLTNNTLLDKAIERLIDKRSGYQH